MWGCVGAALTHSVNSLKIIVVIGRAQSCRLKTRRRHARLIICFVSSLKALWLSVNQSVQQTKVTLRQNMKNLEFFLQPCSLFSCVNLYIHLQGLCPQIALGFYVCSTHITLRRTARAEMCFYGFKLQFYSSGLLFNPNCGMFHGLSEKICFSCGVNDVQYAFMVQKT